VFGTDPGSYTKSLPVNLNNVAAIVIILMSTLTILTRRTKTDGTKNSTVDILKIEEVASKATKL